MEHHRKGLKVEKAMSKAYMWAPATSTALCLFLSTVSTKAFDFMFCSLAHKRAHAVPVLQTGFDDGLVKLRDLPLQHGPQVLPQLIVVLLQLLLILSLVGCDQVLVLLDCLPTPVPHRCPQ